MNFISDKILKATNIFHPCSRYRFDGVLWGVRYILFVFGGTFLGIDLKIIGVLFMVVLLLMNLPRFADMISG